MESSVIFNNFVPLNKKIKFNSLATAYLNNSLIGKSSSEILIKLRNAFRNILLKALNNYELIAVSIEVESVYNLMNNERKIILSSNRYDILTVSNIDYVIDKLIYDIDEGEKMFTNIRYDFKQLKGILLHIFQITDNDDGLSDMEIEISRKQGRLNRIGIENKFIQLESAFKRNLLTYYMKNGNRNLKDIKLILTYYKNDIKNLLLNVLKEHKSLKFNIVIETTYQKPLINEVQDRSFKTQNYILFLETDINSLLDKCFEKLLSEEAKLEGEKSGWTLKKFDGILIRINKYSPLRGSSYIKLPSIIAKKNAVINPCNNDEYCFKWAILSHYVLGPHRERINFRYFRLAEKFNFNCIKFPTTLKDISIFEKFNDITVNVYSYDDKFQIYPLKVVKREKKDHINLLLINDQNKTHYTYIKSMSRLVNSQLNKNKHRKFICNSCLTFFYSVKKLKAHKIECYKNKPVRVVMPEFTSLPPTIKFKNYHHKFKMPIVVYADFESLLLKVSTCFPSDSQSFTEPIELHEPMSFCIYFVISDQIPLTIRSQLPTKPYVYRGKNACKVFMNYLVENCNLIGELCSANIEMNMTEEDMQLFSIATHCEMCGRQFTDFFRPNRDHDHLTGKYRAALCGECNLKRQNQKFIPVILHGSSNYDNHYIVNQLGYDIKDIQVIPNSKEKYITYSKRINNGLRIRFLDSYRFMSRGLAELVQNCSIDQLKHIQKIFSIQDIPLLSRKGVFPYEYIDRWDKLNETQLPSKEAFHSSLSGNISDDDYEFAHKVWNHFKIENLGKYSDLYVMSDTLLLCDVFECFRQLCIDNCNLDCVYYVSLPGFTFDAMLHYTKVEIDLLTDYSMYLFLERGIRGGISICNTHYSKANNRYLGDMYNLDEPTSYLMYLDANNLYGWALSQNMPHSNFQWYSGRSFDVMTVEDNSPIGFILEVDVEYPQNLHDNHNDFPFLPTNEIPPQSKYSKLLGTLNKKVKYICHYINLKQAVNNGLKITRIYRILQFNQSPWLKPYIDFNTQRRQVAKNDFEKDLYKLLINSLFGKTMENIRKRFNLKLVSCPKKLQKLINKPNFLDRIIYNENLCAVEMQKESLYFNKPIYVGFSVLELSKTLMYNFHYNIIKKKYGDSVNLLYCDTDAFFYKIQYDHHEGDFYKDILEDLTLNTYFDTSDYPPSHPCYSIVNKKVYGKFKDECCSKPISEFVGLRAKLYSFKIHDSNIVKKVKGIKKSVVKSSISFQDFINCLNDKIPIRRTMNIIRSYNHNIKTVLINKIALDVNDDKRYLCDDNIHTLAYGHYLIN